MNEHNLLSVAFPTLDETQISQLARCADAAPKLFRDGQTLFAAGERNMNFFVVKSGEVEIVDHSGDERKTVTIHRPGEFTGDVSHLTGLPAVVSGIARGDCEVYEITGDALRNVLNQCPGISDLILQAFIARRQLLRESPNFTGLRVIGSRYSPDTFRVRDFLSKNRILFTWVDVETDPNVDRLLKQFGVTESDTPVVACGSMLLLRNPSNRQLADAIGIRQPLEDLVYDLVVVGAGPAGLAAAVYGASEGLRTAVLEHTAPGGQAGGSMRIENYLGFPTGLTGSELAGRAILQANKFGAHLSVPTPVNRLTFENAYTIVHLDGGETVTAKCLLIATGADYRRLGVEGSDRFEGTGVYYAATVAEAQLCQGIPGRGCRWRQFRRPGGGLSLRPRPPRADSDPGRRPVQEHVQLPGAADRADPQHRAGPQHHHPPNEREWAPRLSGHRQRQDRGGADGGNPGGIQFYRRRPENRLAPPGNREGCEGVRPDRAGSGALPILDFRAAAVSCWRRAGRACSRRGTCGPARSSASPRPSAKAPWRFSSFTSASSTCEKARAGGQSGHFMAGP